MKRTVAVMALVAGALLMLQGATASAGIGQGPCQHGNSNKACREDPQPTHGKDCQTHGKNGGGNQDHCVPAASTPTPSPSPSETEDENPTVVQGKIIKVSGGTLAKTGPNETKAAVGMGLMLIGLGVLVRTFDKKQALEA
jgi:LPXTG-motif cell wall-anchored protein